MYTKIPSLIYQIGKNSSFTVHSVGKAVGKQALPQTSSGNTKWYRRTGIYLIKLHKHLPFEPVIPLQGIYPEDISATI